MIKVRNSNEFDFEAGYNGQTFEFPAGKTVACPDDAAGHIFGLGAKDKSAVLARHGWALATPIVVPATLSQPASMIGTRAQGMSILEKFSFEHVEIKMDAPSALKEHAASVPQDAGADEGAALAAPVRRGPGRPPTAQRFQPAA